MLSIWNVETADIDHHQNDVATLRGETEERRGEGTSLTRGERFRIDPLGQLPQLLRQLTRANGRKFPQLLAHRTRQRAGIAVDVLRAHDGLLLGHHARRRGDGQVRFRQGVGGKLRDVGRVQPARRQ